MKTRRGCALKRTAGAARVCRLLPVTTCTRTRDRMVRFGGGNAATAPSHTTLTPPAPHTPPLAPAAWHCATYWLHTLYELDHVLACCIWRRRCARDHSTCYKGRGTGELALGGQLPSAFLYTHCHTLCKSHTLPPARTATCAPLLHFLGLPMPCLPTLPPPHTCPFLVLLPRCMDGSFSALRLPLDTGTATPCLHLPAHHLPHTTATFLYRLPLPP